MHDGQAMVARPFRANCITDPIVIDDQDDFVLLMAIGIGFERCRMQADGHMIRLGMFDHIVQRFLGDAIEGGVNIVDKGRVCPERVGRPSMPCL